MDDIFIVIFRALETYLPNEDARKNVYNELIPVIHDSDSDLLESLLGYDEEFDQAYQEYLIENQEENFDDV